MAAGEGHGGDDRSRNHLTLDDLRRLVNVALGLRPGSVRRRLLNALLSDWRPIPMAALVKLVWPGADGGPLNAARMIGVEACLLRKTLAAGSYALVFRSLKNSPTRGYRIERRAQ